ncbi:MAG: hypothetical protein CK536_09505 [Synechococcus sp. Baikal-G1]|nr:MAG: hypothetical protein CK536_09505 [Synechococcus sp. Baikal-G1]
MSLGPAPPQGDAPKPPEPGSSGRLEPFLRTLLAGGRQLGGRLGRLAARLQGLPGGASLWVGLASAGFLLAALGANGRQLQQLSLDGQGWAWLLLGLGLALLSLVVNGLAWTLGLAWLGHRPRWLPAVLLFLRSNLRKYLPGGVWHLLQRLAVLRQGAPAPGMAGFESPVAEPLDLRQGLVAVLLDPVLMAVAALALVACGGWQGGLAALGLAPLLLLRPRWFRPLLLRLERRRQGQLQRQGWLGEEPEPAGEANDPQGLSLEPAATGPILQRYPLVPLAGELAFVLVRFSGFACCVLAFDVAPLLPWNQWLSGFALAWTLGLVVPGAPGGLGVFEAALLLRLGGLVPEAPLLAIALSYRLVTSLADLLGAATAELDQRWSSGR